MDNDRNESSNEKSGASLAGKSTDQPLPFVIASYEADERAKRAARYAADLDYLLPIRGMRVLEVGCGLGDLSNVLATKYECDVVGVDISSHDSWRELRNNNRLQFLVMDIAQTDSRLASKSFDLIISYVAWEHIRHPWSALVQCQRLLKDTGKMYLYAWLERSSAASHLYREVKDPWPHLMKSPAEIMQAYNIKDLGWSFWCNKLTYQQYLFYFRQLGFYITYENLFEYYFDKDYYNANEIALGLYPQWDLRTDAFQVILEFDQAVPRRVIPDPVYRLRTGPYVNGKLVDGGGP
jgi:ubiquinone/menaquinone biosynthesis C-methylase UbiE